LLQAAKETLGARSLAVRVDVSNLTDVDTMFATIKREFGHPDGVFVNAGYSEFMLFEEVTEQSFDRVIGSNFKGAAVRQCDEVARRRPFLQAAHRIRGCGTVTNLIFVASSPAAN
jgi:NAD(P)-dependent dehydrogenase (short-subunit alcohol dehydrogenase family)